MEHILIIIQTEDDGNYLLCNENGEIVMTESNNNEVVIQHLFNTDDVIALNKIMDTLDPIVLKRSKHLLEMLPDFFKITPPATQAMVTKLTIDVDDNKEFDVHGVLLSTGAVALIKSGKFKYQTHAKFVYGTDDNTGDTSQKGQSNSSISDAEANESSTEDVH